MYTRQRRPTGHSYVGVDYAKKLCGVSIIRSGESMENALRDCCKGIKIGKVLVHRERALMNTLSNMEAEARSFQEGDEACSPPRELISTTQTPVGTPCTRPPSYVED